MKPIIDGMTGGIDWASGPDAIGLHCPFGAGVSVSLYTRWEDVPKWWTCTCGAEHRKEEPGAMGVTSVRATPEGMTKP